MATVCPNIPALIQDEKFKKVKEIYKDRNWSDFVLASYLNAYRSAEDLDMDWFPETEEDFRGFTDYLNRPIDNERSQKIKKEDLEGLYKTMTTLYSSPQVLDRRLDLISRWFSSRVDFLMKDHPGLTRHQVIRGEGSETRNGFQAIMDEVFKMVNGLSNLEAQKKVFEKQNPGATDELWEQKKDFWQRRADEFKKIYDNKDFLAALVAPKISAIESIAVGIDGLTIDFGVEQPITNEELIEEEDNSIDTGEAQKGDRYVDFRTLSMISTLAVEAKNLITSLNRVDASGNLVRDDLGYTIPLDIRQTAIALHRVLRQSEPSTMMNDLRDAVVRYPDLRSLVEHLEKKPDDRTIVYVNFKKAHSDYYSGYKTKSGKLDVHSSGNVADGYELSREAGSNLSIGSTAAEPNSVVNSDGTLKDLDFFKKLYNDKTFYSLLDEVDWASAGNDSTIDKLASLLTGLGFQVSAEDLKAVFSSYPSQQGLHGEEWKDVTPIKKVSRALRDIYDKGVGIIGLGDDLTGQHLYTYAQKSFSEISKVLSPLQKGETEERVISGDKSLAANINPNALHQMVDIISNAKGQNAVEYKRTLMNEYGQYEGYGLGFGDNVRLTGWLADATGDTDYKWKPESFQLKDFTDSERTSYAQMTDLQHRNNSYVMFMRGAKNRADSIADNGHMYEIPIQADYETAYNFIFAPGYKMDELVERLAQEVECEAQRIAAIKERLFNDPIDPSAELTRAKDLTYEDRGQHFLVFPELDTNGFAERYAAASPVDAHNLVLTEVREQLNKKLLAERKKLSDAGMFAEDNLKLLGLKSEEDRSIDSWIVNSFYARQQVTKLLYGGLEHFKNTSDFEKRNMYAHATRLPLYTEATYNGKKVGKENQRVLYISDDNARSAIYDQICKIVDKLIKQHKITSEQAERMKAAYESITTTDGQGIRTLDSMRAIKIMAGRWTDADETAYKNIKGQHYTPEDVEHFMVGEKPIYTGYEILSAQFGQYQKPIKVPVLHKYSEMVLLPEIMEGISLQNDTVPFKALNRINDKLGAGNEIDLFLFGSCVKVGGHSLIDAFAKDKKGNRILKDADSISDFVSNKIKSADFWVHTLPLKYYGIAASVHADVSDNNIAWASQAEKEAWANILPNEKISVGGREMSAAQTRELYNQIKSARAIDAFQKLKKLFYSDHKLATILKEELASKPYQSRELSFLLQVIDGEGSWSTPLYQPSMQHDVVALLSSIIKKRLTKIPTKGANILQTSGFGMDMDASGFDETGALKDSDKLEVKFDKDGNFQYVEAYVPIHDNRLIQFADDNGNISPERLNDLTHRGIIPESVLNFIAYRTPSDAEHSVIPCRIKGFIANTAGASIRLPKEIMVMTGHDYDGDKMRCHFKDFYIGWNDKQIQKDFEKFSDTEATKAILSDNDDPTLTPYEVFRRNVTSDTNPDAGKYRIVKDVKYDYDKTPLQNIGNNSDYRALNNAMVDLMFAQLTSEAGSAKMFIPGGNAETTVYAGTMRIMRAYGGGEGQTIADSLHHLKVKSDVITEALRNPVNLYRYLTRQDSKTLSSIIGDLEGLNSPFDVTHATESHGYMMDGAGMIGVYAVYNSAAAMFQRLNLNYIPTVDDNGNKLEVRLLGKQIGKLFDVISNDSYSTLGLARLLNAAVDNGKNPVLGHLNQTAQLAPITNFLFAAGLSEEDIHLILNQPVLIELGKRMKDPNAPGFIESSTAVLYEITRTLPKDEKYYRTDGVRRTAMMPKETYISNLSKSYQDILGGSKKDKEDQIYILQTLQHLFGAASDLDMFTKLTRPESQSGGIDSSLGGTVAKIIQLDQFRERLVEGVKASVSISGMDDVIALKTIYPNSMTDQMIQDAMGSELPEVVTLNTLLKDGTPRLFREKFPQTKESWMRVQKRVASQYTYQRIPDSVLNRIQSDMILWKLLSDSDFVTDNPQQEQKRILEEVPEQLRQLKQRIVDASTNPGTDVVADNLAHNIFLSNLDLGTTLNEENQTIRRIRFRQNGPSVEHTADLIRAGWDQLYQIDETKQLAEDLFKYNLYTNGFSYGRYEFFHYAPFSLFYGMKGYQKALMNVRNTGWSDEEENQFYHQYCMNHWGDKNFLTKISVDMLPMNLLSIFGIEEASPKSLSNDAFDAMTAGKDMIIVSRNNYGKEEDHLCLIVRNESGKSIGLIELPKMGIRNGSNQIMVQYNPKVRDFREVRPTFVSNKVAWETKKTLSLLKPEVNALENQALQNAIDDEPYDYSLITGKTVNDIQEKAETASTANSGKLTAEQAAAFGFDDEMFSIVERDKNGNPVIKLYKGTPEIVSKAREQQAYAELNKRLREILREMGVSVGALNEAEARLMVAGVTDFKAARVLAEGMRELIRLSNGIEGEYALPEEFAHVAIEMLGHDQPLVKRLLTALDNNDTALKEAYDGQLDEYKKRYGEDNREKLVLEAAGKLVAKHLFLHQVTKTNSVKSLVKRVCDAIKKFFKRFSLRKVENAIYDAEGIASQLARDLLSGRLADEMSLDKITSSNEFYQVEKDLSNKEDILSKLMARTVKRADVLSRRVKYSLGRGATSRSLDETKNQIAKLEKAIQDQKVEAAIIDYLQDAMVFMKEMEQSLDKTVNNSSANSVCKKLQIVKDTMFGFAEVLNDIDEAIQNDEIEDVTNLEPVISAMNTQMTKFWRKYHRISMQYFELFLQNIYGKDGVTVTVGKDKGRVISIKEMARKKDRDINSVARLMHAASDIDDYVLQAMDAVTRDAKIAARDRVRDLKPQLEAAMAALIKEQGSRDQSWMYERQNVNGKMVRTGRYISREKAEKLSEAQKNFYNIFMELKHLADLCVPEFFVSDRKMIMFRKEHYERMKDAQTLSGKKDEVWENAKRSVLEMGDVDFETEQVVLDFADNKVDQLPLKFLNKGKNESYDDMTEDAATSLLAYMGMAFEYKEMNGVIGMLENARYMASRRDVEQRKGFKLKVERVGKEDEFHYTKPYTVKAAKTNIQTAINDFYQMHVYGHLRADEGTIGKTRISKRKVVDTTNRFTSLAQMAVNIHQRIANVNTGFTQILVESAGGKIKAKDVTWAVGQWVANSGTRLAETGKTDYTNKLSLFLDYFDIHQDNGREVRTTKYGRSDSSRVFNEGLLYAGLSIGEDFLAGTTALALAHTMKLTGPDGKPANLWDAYEVKYIDSENKTGAHLVLKNGYKKEDGSALTKQDELKYRKEVIGTNFELQGIYNTDDRSAVQQYSLGALAIMYRKWIAPAMKRRYAGLFTGEAQYSNLKGQFEQGYYTTALSFTKDVFGDLFEPVSEEESRKNILRILTDFRALSDSIQMNWSKLTDYEKGNVKKACTEMAVMICLITASMLLKNLPPDDHDGNKFLSWADDIVVTQLLRLRSEIGSQAPTPMLANEALRIASSPVAALRPLRDSLNIFNLMWAPNYWEIVESGRYRGRTKAHKYFMKLPIVSMFRKFDNFIDPSDMLNYYKNQNY